MKKLLHLLLILFFVNIISAQNSPNDCVNAIVVYGNGTITTTATGIGTTQEVAGCSSQEHNSVWLKINIGQAGTLGFDLIPNDPSITADYDFWVYGPNKTCGTSLGSPIRCSTTNPLEAGLPNNYTGINGSVVNTTSGPGANGSGYVSWLSVLAGQTYYIVIDRPYVGEGFKIQWTGTATIASDLNLAVETPTLRDFNAKVYPNPFNTSFVIDVNTLSQEPLTIKVYDMLGRLVEQIEGIPSKMAEQKIGQSCASGIYSMVLTQENVVKTLRVIKE